MTEEEVKAYMALTVEERIEFLKEQQEKFVVPTTDIEPDPQIEATIKSSKQGKAAYQQFDTAEINSMSIRSFLEQQGYQRTSGNEAHGMYLAEYRGDINPSLKVDYIQNRWYDFGTGQGGSIIDLVKEMYAVEFKQACSILCSGNIPRVEVQAKPTEKAEPKINILGEKPVSHIALVKYYTGRGIDKATAMKYLKEVNYSVNGSKPYFALGFKNDSGGFELRNDSPYKFCSSKDITTIDKKLPNCNIYEGFFDFLSYESLSVRFPQQYPPANAIVLNSTANIEKSTIVDFAKKHKEVLCFMDNDNAGKQAYNTLNKKLSEHCHVGDYSSFYAECKDFNEFHVKNHKISNGIKR